MFFRNSYQASFFATWIGIADEGILPLLFAYARPIVTFANGDQLRGYVTDGSGCLSVITGYFAGEAQGDYSGGTRRFDSATGSFVVSFAGDNLTLPDLGVGFGSIRGEIKGRINR